MKPKTIEQLHKENAWIKPYSEKMKSLHTKVQKLVTTKQFRQLDADDMMIVFARVYSTYCLATLHGEGKLAIVEKGKIHYMQESEISLPKRKTGQSQ